MNRKPINGFPWMFFTMKAMVLCGSGNGAQMTANHHPRVRAALCWNVELGKLARQHNNANMIAIGAGFTGPKLASAMVQAFLSTEFEGGRHQRRVDLIMDIENRN